jgi:hypothetical protein
MDDEEGEAHRDDQIAKHGDHRRDDSERGAVEAHAPDVNPGQDRDECREPPAVEVDARLFLGLDTLGDRRHPGRVLEREILDHADVGVALREDRLSDHLPERAEDAEPRGDRDSPVL